MRKKKNKHPMQPIFLDEQGVARFKENPIIRFLLNEAHANISHVVNSGFSQEDIDQFTQLLGCSVCAFGDYGFASKKAVKKADKKARKLNERRSKGN